MAKAKLTPRTLRIERHKDGSVWAKGYMRGEVMDGPWNWFRKDGTRMRSGSFDNCVQAGKWVTYDQSGEVYKVTLMKNPARAATRRANPEITSRTRAR